MTYLGHISNLVSFSLKLLVNLEILSDKWNDLRTRNILKRQAIDRII